MVHEPPRRTALSGPTLVRLLARLTDTDVRESRLTLADCLSQWLGWSDAIALSGVLGTPAPAARAATHAPDDGAQGEFARLQAEFDKAIAGVAAPKPVSRPGQRRAPASGHGSAATEFGTYRRAYSSLQHSMESNIAALRARLRTRLAAHSPELARLALVDAAMEQALMAREYGVFAGIPALLEKHFERLREAEEAALADAEAAAQPAPIKPGAWVDMFRQDMQNVLRAELEIRLQPLEGLLAACRAR